MLLILQFPLCDLRPFISPRERLSRPHWPNPDSSVEFVRYFGSVKERKTREVYSSDERMFCGASKALKFGGLVGHPELRIAIRRLFSDGRAIARFEVGFRIAANNLSRGDLLAMVRKVLEIECTPRCASKVKPLVMVGSDLAKLYAKATHRKQEEVTAASVTAGRPCLVVEYEANEIAELPLAIDYQKPERGLAFSKLTHHGIDVNTWYVSAQVPNSRMRRLLLLRVHAEHQALKYVLRAIDDGRISLTRGSASSDDTQAFLSDTMALLTKGERFGVAQQELLDVVHTYEDLCAKDEIAILKQKVDGIRRQTKETVLKEVERSASMQPPDEPRIGPKFVWHGPIDELEYHSFFSRGSSISMSFQWASGVLNNLCPAVCLISMPKRGRTATGFLVGKSGLLLTNYHVVGGEFDDEDVVANVSDIRLTFEASSDKTRVFQMAALDTSLPLSKVKEHDFALLRTTDNIASILNFKPILYDSSAMPVPKRSTGIYILQHPEGGLLNVSGDADGVTGVYEEEGTVQYISKAEHGSSGGPCFDQSLNLVAIHHAEVERPFGRIREGILFKTIYPLIQKFI